MNCHICAQPSVGQCQSCWKFYCKDHGDIRCEHCADKPQEWVATSSRPMFLEARPVTSEEEAEELKEYQQKLEEMPVLKFKGDVLERVIPVVQTLTIGKTQITITALEVYNDGFTMGYEIRRTDADLESIAALMEPTHPEIHWKARDDTGQSYTGMNFGGGSTHRGWRTREVFAPPFTKDAKLFVLEAEEVLWMAHGVGMRSRAEPGPWRFEILLT